MTADRETDEAVHIVLPARTELAATLRVIALSLGADLGFTVDDLDDLRLAVNEVFIAAASDASHDRVAISLRPDDSAIEVTARFESEGSIPLDDLALTILRSVVELDESDDGLTRFSKRASRGTP